ncbi:hypothetical protein GCU56_08880 [Geodermatophilus sabuli]|uniref:Arabinosyltransferase n=1 Tax=Geodermatophilus sabuli TaxID=1564158 RepID=A0A7K3W1A2_9ACTN|nr:arabinosyltransferase domain-containing protein [Geodermatophilus sabuli]NEK57984.1 hypothetical protein [Geodermatophilus sabuli]
MDLIDAERTEAPSDRSPVGPGRWRGLLPLLLALVAIVGAVALPLAPVQMSMPTVSWPQDPARPTSTMLELTNQQPLDLAVSFSCAAVAAAGDTPDGVLLATLVPGQEVAVQEGLVAGVRDGRLAVVVRGQTLLEEPVPAGPCTYRLAGDSSGLRAERDGVPLGTLTADAGQTVLPDVDVLATSVDRLPSDDDLRVELGVDNQFNTTPSAVKELLTAVVLLAALGALVALWRADRRTGRRTPGPDDPEERRPRRPLHLVVDAVVVATLLLWLFLAPPTDDDGYYAAMARNAPDEGFVGNYYQLLNQSFTPFTWFYRLLGWWDAAVGSSPVLLRLPALAVGLVSWLLLRRFLAQPGVVPAAVLDRRHGQLAATVLGAATFLAWWLPYGMGVRPEAVVGVLALVALHAVVAAVRRQRLLPVAVAFGAAGLAATCHPTGLVALAPLLAGLPWLVPLVRAARSPLDALTRTALVLAPGALAAAAAFADGTLNDFLRGQEIFLSVQEQDSWDDEWMRYSFLLNQIPMGNYAKRTAVLLALVALVWFLVAGVAIRSRGVRLPVPLVLPAASLALALLLLWFTPSKWTHHFGALSGLGPAFLAAFLVAVPWLVGQATGGRRPSRAVPVLALGSAVVVFALVFRGPNSWPYSWLPGMPHPFVAPFFSVVSFGSPLLWLAVVGASVGAVALLRRRTGRSGSPSWAGAVPLAVLVFLLTSVLHLVGSFSLAAARTVDSWSPWADALTDPLAEECGAAGAMEVLDVGAARPIDPEQDGPDPAEGAAFVRDGGWFPVSPPPGGSGQGAAAHVWGSLSQPGTEDATGATQTAWFPVPDTGPDAGLAVLAAGQLAEGNELRAEYGVREGDGPPEVVGTQDLADTLDSPAWRTFVLDPAGADASGADLVRLVAEDRSGGPGGWLAFTGPSVVPAVTLADLVPDDAPVATAWQIAFSFPCLRQPVVRHGITEPSEYGVVWRGGPVGNGLEDNTWQDLRGGLFAPVRRTSSVTELPASFPSQPGVADIQVFRFGVPYPVGAYDLAPARVQQPGWAGPPSG